MLAVWKYTCPLFFCLSYYEHRQIIKLGRTRTKGSFSQPTHSLLLACTRCTTIPGVHNHGHFPYAHHHVEILHTLLLTFAFSSGGTVDTHLKHGYNFNDSVGFFLKICFINSQPSHMTTFIDRTWWCFASMVPILSHVQVGSTTSLNCARVEELYRADAQNRTLMIVK